MTNALPARCVGRFTCRDTNGNVHIFAGTAAGLYKLSGQDWVDVTRVSGNYATSSDGWWSFVVYGNRVIATNLSDAVQNFVLGADTKFSALAGSPPKAEGVAVVNNFVVLNGIDGFLGRVQWCALDDPTDWTPSASTQADYNDIPGDGGKVQAVIGSQNVAIVVMEKEIWRMDYVGPDVIFSFTLVESKRGTPAPQSVTGDGINVYYLGEDGFYYFNGSISIPIGHLKVDRYFLNNVDKTYLFSQVQGVSDPNTKTVMWGYPNTNDADDGTITRLLAYSWADIGAYGLGKWTEALSTVQTFFSGLTSGFTMEQIGAIYPTMEDVPFSLDSPVWQGGRYVLAGVDSSGRLGYFDGENLDAILTTTEARLNDGGVATVQAVLPITDASDVTVRLGSRMRQSDAVTYTPSATPHARTGECNFKVAAAYHRAEIALTGDWILAQGVQFRFNKAGR